MSTTYQQSRGLTTYNTKSWRSLLVCCVLSILALILHATMPSTPFYTVLLVVLLVINVGALWLCVKVPHIAVQVYWWTALIVTAAMVYSDFQTGVPGLPYIVAIPSVATLFIRLLVSMRAAAVYGIGVLALLIPTGLAYNEIGQAVALCGVVVLTLTIRGGVREQLDIIDDETRIALLKCRERLKQMNDAERARE